MWLKSLVVVEYNSALGQFTSARLPKEVLDPSAGMVQVLRCPILAVSKVMVSYDYSLLYTDKKSTCSLSKMTKLGC